MGRIHHTVDKTVVHGHINDFREAAKERRMTILTILFLIVIVLYFVYVLNRVATLLQAAGTKGNITSQFLLLLPHLIMLSLFGTPIVRKVLLWIKFTPFYLPRQVIRDMRSKTYNKVRIKRFIVYFIVSFIVFLIALFYMFIL